MGNLLLMLSCLFMAAVASAADRTVYYHTDFLGSVVAATDESGALLWRESYRPFGERIDREVSTKENTPFYTGKPHDDDTGLSYFGARDYDPMVGRFLGIDPAGVDPANLHSFNRYAYANNNPYKYVDPDGRLPVLAVFVVKELVSIAIEQSTGVSVPISVGGALKGAAKHNAKKQAAKIASSKKGAREAATKRGPKLLPAPKTRGRPNTAPQNGTIYVDSKGNALVSPPGGRITGSPDGRYIQVRDAAGKQTGTRIDAGHNPKGHPDPRAQQPHGHVPGVTNPDGTPWLPINQ